MLQNATPNINLIPSSSQNSVNIFTYSPRTVVETLTVRQSTNYSPEMLATQIDLRQKSPVEIIGDEISINEGLLSVGEWYDYTLKGKKYVLHVPKEGVIEIYEVKA